MNVTKFFVVMVVTLTIGLTDYDLDAQDRSRLAGGLSLGLGRLAIPSSGNPDAAVDFITLDPEKRLAAALDLHLGSMISRNTAIFFEFAGAGHARATGETGGRVTIFETRQVTFGPTTSTVTAYTAVGSVQHWLTQSLWVRGGLGGGFLDRDITAENPKITLTVDKTGGLAVLGVAGFEFWHANNFASDLQFHFTTFAVQGVRINAPTIQVGFNFY
jgi:hypothetical protein